MCPEQFVYPAPFINSRKLYETYIAQQPNNKGNRTSKHHSENTQNNMLETNYYKMTKIQQNNKYRVNKYYLEEI